MIQLGTTIKMTLSLWTLVVALTILAAGILSAPSDNFGADPGCQDPWTTEWTRDGNDCKAVYFCVLGKVIHTMQCNESRVWSNVGHACVEPFTQWDDCNQTPTTPIINDPRCINPDGINPNPDNCAQFLACTNRTVVATMNCPENTLFGTRNNTCELGFLVAEECKSRLIPNNIIVTTASPIFDLPCEEKKNGDVADETNCLRFYKCNHGRIVARIKCPTGSGYSTQKNKCDWLSNVDCDSRPIQT